MKNIIIRAIAAGVLALTPVLAQAQTPKSFVLNCLSKSYFPTGVPNTLTDRNVLVHFKEWCADARTPNLVVYYDHEFDARVMEADGIGTANTSRLLNPNFVPTTTTTTSSGTTVVTSNFLNAIPVGVTQDGVYQPYWRTDSFGNGAFFTHHFYPGLDGGDYAIFPNTDLAEFCSVDGRTCHFNFNSTSSSTTTGARTVKKVRPLNTCNPHNHYRYTNSRTLEKVDYHKSGGACVRVYKSTVGAGAKSTSSTSYSGATQNVCMPGTLEACPLD